MSDHQKPSIWIFLILGLIMTLQGCGKLSLSLTDAPVDSAEKIVLVFTGIEIQPADDSVITIDFDDNKSIDMMTLTDGVTDTLLIDEPLPRGSYNWIKLKLDISNSFITINGADIPLRMPAGSESGLTVTRSFKIEFGGSLQFIIDFDLRKSVFNPEGSNPDYVLRPSLRIMEDLDTGSVTGTVDASLLSANSNCFDNSGAITAVVYVYANHDIVADDIDGNAPFVITSAQVRADNAFSISFLDKGDYTVALTCDALQDDPALDNSLNFLRRSNIVITEGQNTSLNF